MDQRRSGFLNVQDILEGINGACQLELLQDH